MSKIIYLVDASTFIHRSYHAIRNLSTKDGRPTNAVYGFVSSLLKVLREKKPEYIIVAYDAKGPSHRVEIYDRYKANRPPMPEDLIVQQEPIRRIVGALGIPAVEIPGLEADDIIASLADQARRQGFEAVIVANDKDYYQLLDRRVSMYDPNPKHETTTTAASIKEKYGLDPAAFLDVQGLMGDSTDSIPGVPGVGEKTAVRLIREFGGLEELFARLDEIKQEKLKQKLKDNKDAAFLSRQLARLVIDADVGLDPSEAKIREPNTAVLRELYKDLEFNRFLDELGPDRVLGYDDYHLVDTEALLEALIEELMEADCLSVDLETTSLDSMKAEIVGLSLAAKPHRAFYLPVGHKGLSGPQLDRSKSIEKLKPILEDETIPKVGQNIKYDYMILKRHGVELKPVRDDSMIASYLIDPGAGGHGLDHLSRTLLGHDPISYEEAVGAKGVGFDTISPEAAKDYACEDADVALMLSRKLRPELERLGLIRLYEDLEMPLVTVLADMEMEGVALDTALLSDLSREFSGQMKEIETRIHHLAGKPFNINSPKQLGEILFDELNLPTGKKTTKKSGYSTDVEVLTELAKLHELPAKVLAYRGLNKLKSTYVDALAGLVHPETGRVHTSFNQAVTATGRLSSSDPNLQNIPIRTEEGRRIRQAFIARPGSLILSADYSQIELRILAHFSGDELLQEAFRSGEDIHTRTASEVFNLMPNMITPDMRREAKAINFGIVYGLGAFGLARQLGIERKQAQNYIDEYFRRYAGVKRFIDATLEQAHRDGYVKTLLGRRRNLPEIHSKNHQTRSMAERMAINTPIQGTAADLIKLAMLGVRRAIGREGLRSRMILQVHDELVFDVPEEEMDVMMGLVKREMETVYDLDVPLVVDAASGKNWAEAH
jgi:DNA polymerase I